jgi:hypothetical protein
MVGLELQNGFSGFLARRQGINPKALTKSPTNALAFAQTLMACVALSGTLVVAYTSVWID